MSLSSSKMKKSKRKIAKKEVKAEPVYIGLSDPVELRKHILEPTREVIQFLQSYEQFKKMKEEKTQAILQLKEDLRGIRASFNQLRRLLPRNKVKAEKTYRKIKKEIKKEQKIPERAISRAKPATVRPPTELEALEKELGEIEKKLGTIPE